MSTRTRLRLLQCLVTIYALSFGFSAPTHAFQIAVSPPKFHLEIGSRPVAKSIQIVNQGDKPMDIRVSVANFDLDDKNEVREIAPTEQSLDQWIIVRPLKLTIPPGKTRSIRFAIRPYTRPSRGEHKGMIFIEQAGKPTAKLGTVPVRYRLGVAVYGQVGSALRKGSAGALIAGRRGFGIEVKSTGNAHVRARAAYMVWPVKSFPGQKTAGARANALRKRTGPIKPTKGAILAGHFPSLPVFPGTKRRVEATFASALPPGKYRLALRGTLGKVPLSFDKTFSVPATQ